MTARVSWRFQFLQPADYINVCILEVHLWPEVARFGPISLNPRSPKSLRASVCGSLSREMRHMYSWDEGVQVFCLFRTRARQFPLFLAPWFGHEKNRHSGVMMTSKKNFKHADRRHEVAFET